jgi:type I restriction enzyme S subunit
MYFYLREHFGAYVQQRAVTATVTSLRKPMISGFPMPLLPIAQQAKVAATLDQLDAFVNDVNVGLPAEMSTRRMQYEHYRDKLFTFDEVAA